MSNLQVVYESSRNIYRDQRDLKSKIPNIVIHTEPESISPGPGIPPPRDANIFGESFVSDSYDSSFDSPPDSEILTIKNITQTLQSGVSKQLKHYKSSSNLCSQQNEFLKEQVLSYKSDLDSVKETINELMVETYQTHRFIRSVRESIHSRDSRIMTEEGPTVFSYTEVNFIDSIKKLHNEIDKMTEKIDNDQKELKKQHFESESALKVSNHLILDEQPQKASCKCSIF